MKKLIGIIVAATLMSSTAMAAATCNDADQIRQIKAKYICQIFDCAQFDMNTPEGFDRYQKMSTQQIEGLARSVTEDWSLPILHRAFLAGQHLIVSFNAVPESYDPALKRYVCQGTFEFDPQARKDMMQFVAVLALAKDPTFQQTAFMVNAGRQKTGRDLSGLLMMQINQTVQVLEQNGAFHEGIKYAVQPRDPTDSSSETVISLPEVAMWDHD